MVCCTYNLVMHSHNHKATYNLGSQLYINLLYQPLVATSTCYITQICIKYISITQNLAIQLHVAVQLASYQLCMLYTWEYLIDMCKPDGLRVSACSSINVSQMKSIMSITASATYCTANYIISTEPTVHKCVASYYRILTGQLEYSAFQWFFTVQCSYNIIFMQHCVVLITLLLR